MILENEDGDQLRLGAERIVGDRQITIRPDAPGIDLPSVPDRGWDFTAERENGVVQWSFIDETGSTELLDVTVRERFTDEILVNESYLNPKEVIGSVEASEDGDYVVEWERTGETTNSGEEIISERVDAALTDIIPDDVRMAAGIIALLLVVGSASAVSATSAVVVAPVVGGLLWWFGWLQGATGPAAITIAMLFAALFAFYKSRGSL